MGYILIVIAFIVLVSPMAYLIAKTQEIINKK